MKRPGRTIRRLVAALVLGPPLLWALVLGLLPMGWARDRVVARLEAESGQRVGLGRVRLRALGGIRLDDLTFAAKGTPGDPWLNVATLVLDVSARDLLVGQVAPTNAILSGVKLRVRRDGAGRLEFEDLFRPDRMGPKPANQPPPEAGRSMAYRIEDASVLVVDDGTATRLELSEIEGHGTVDGLIASLDEMTGKLNGGMIALAAKVDRSAGRPLLEGEVRAERVALGMGMKALTYAIPLLATAAEDAHARGVLTLDLFLKSSGATSQAVAKNLAGRGTMELDELALSDSRLMAEVTRELPIPLKAKIGTLSGSFEIARGRVSTGDTVLKLADQPIRLTGWSDFDGRLDYLVKAEDLGKKVHNFAEKLPTEAREFLDELPLDDLDGLIDLEVSGTIDHPTVKPVEGSLLSKRAKQARDPARRNEEKARLKQAGKKFLDRLIR